MHVALVGGAHDAGGERVRGRLLEARHEREHAVGVLLPHRAHVHHAEVALGERARLVHHDDVHARRHLEGTSAAHEQAVARAERGGARRHERNGQAQRVRARDDEHGDHARERVAHIARHREPHGERRDAHAHRRVEQPPGHLVGQHFGVRLLLLRLGHELHDLREVARLAGAGDAHVQRAVAVLRAAEHGAARLRLHGAGLACDERFVDRRRAVGHLAVGGHLLPRFHHDRLPHLHPIERHVGEGAVGLLHVGLGGQELGHLLERVARAHDGAHLDPMAQQHDDDERGQLPEEVHVRVGHAEHAALHERVDAVDVGGGDAERHERHHGGLAAAQLVCRAAQKRPAAVPEQHGGQRRHEPVGAGERERDGQRKPHGRRQQHDGDGKHEAHEEPALEIHPVHHHAARRIRAVLPVCFHARSSRPSVCHRSAYRAVRRIAGAGCFVTEWEPPGNPGRIRTLRGNRPPILHPG